MRLIFVACTLALLIGPLAGCASAAHPSDAGMDAATTSYLNVQPVSPPVPVPLPPALVPAATPSPPPGPEASVLNAFQPWLWAEGSRYRDVTVSVQENLGNIAVMKVVAWVRSGEGAAWEVQTAMSTCWLFGGSWQCDGDLAFRPADAETKRAASLSATATAVAAGAAPVAEIDGVPILASDFQKRMHFEKYAMEHRLERLQQREYQFDDHTDVFMQISGLLSTLDSPFALGAHTLDSMIEEAIIAKEAAARGISVSDEEVDQALRGEIANTHGLVTQPQATATAAAGEWTPTPAATPAPNANAAPIAATLVKPPPAIVADSVVAQGIAGLEKDLATVSGMTLTDYREIVRSRLLREKVSAAVGKEKDGARPKGEAQLEQERAQAFQTWLSDQVSGDRVKRPQDLVIFLPRDLTDPANDTHGTDDGVSETAPQHMDLTPDVPSGWINGAALGDPNAPLEVQIWVDYLCASCERYAKLVEPQLIEKYVKPGKVRLTVHFFPLQQYEPETTLAALAAACAGEQNRFWPYHWHLMTVIQQQGQVAATVEALNTYASQVGLDPDTFRSCLAEKKEAGAVAASAAEAQALNLQFVPSVIVGSALLPDNTFESVQAEIERQLQP